MGVDMADRPDDRPYRCLVAWLLHGFGMKAAPGMACKPLIMRRIYSKIFLAMKQKICEDEARMRFKQDQPCQRPSLGIYHATADASPARIASPALADLRIYNTGEHSEPWASVLRPALHVFPFYRS